jgi:Fibronectin type III domain
MASSIIYLSDCTPLYTTLGAPVRVPSVSGYPLNRSVQLEWQVPSNTENILVESYIVRYKLTGAPLSHTLSEVLTFFPTVIISGLSNGVSYDFWVVAKNRFGESPHSPTISVTPGAAPSAIQFVRRAYHSTTSGNGIDGSNPQKVGIEITPSVTQNGAQSLTITAKYTRLNGANAMSDISYTEIYSIQTNEIMIDVSGMPTLNTNGVKGNYIRKEITVPTGTGTGTGTGASGFQSGLYRFQAFSSNIYGISAVPDLSFVLQLYSNTDANTSPAIARFTSPTFASYSVPANGGIVGITPGDTTFRFRWKQYRGIGTGSTGADAYSGWVYRIQYTDDKDNWYYPPVSVSMPYTAKYPEYTVAYDRTSVGSGGADFEYFIDISRNVINGRRYYVRYCVVNAAGDTSEYTQVTTTSSNLSLVSAIPGKLPNPPPIFNASTGDRLVKLYFNWTTLPPSLDLTGGVPILDYRIERYIVSRTNGSFNTPPNSNAVFDNVPGPYYQDNFDMNFNGIEYQYRVFTRNAFGLSTLPTRVTAIPSRKSDVVRNVTSSVDSGQITLSWIEPSFLEPQTPIVQYYIEYKEFYFTDISDIPFGNIVGTFSDQNTISNTVQDMNSILVNDVLWAKILNTEQKIYTNSLNRSYTISNLINNKPYVFRVAAVTQDSARRKLVGLINVIGSNSPYLQHPIIIGKVPIGMTNVEYINGDSSISIKWSGSDINNTEGIIRFIVEYDIVVSDINLVYSQRQTFDYVNSVIFNDGSTNVTFNVIVTGLNNNVPQRPDSRTNSYVMRIYAENSVGFTNNENKTNLHDINDKFDIFEGLTVPRVLRPRTTPSIIAELRT